MMESTTEGNVEKETTDEESVNMLSSEIEIKTVEKDPINEDIVEKIIEYNQNINTENILTEGEVSDIMCEYIVKTEEEVMPSQDEDVGDQACMVSGIVKLEDDGPRQPKLAVYCPKTYQNEIRDFHQVCNENSSG